ncbi:MAG: WYL domain-containing protein [Chloroflexi bacterium]|nr:MAG: WYL domain-containing protein [Chloroflexota bacterium]TMF94891.1 MAG: WYL domain-containing protein [Chloroflexota bacterium]
MRADRLLSILLLLQAHGRLSTTELAQRLEVSRRTVFRDLDALSGAGVPVATERGPNGGAYLLNGYRTDLTGLTEPELEALLAFGGQGPAADLGLGRELDQASRKLAAAARPRSAGRLQERVLIDGGTWFRGARVPSHLTRVQDALWSNRRLRLRYRRDVDRVVERIVEPYGLVCKAGTWYMLAGVGGETRTYRISRIEGAELTDETFERPARFDLREIWATQVGRFRNTAPQRVAVKVRVDPEVSAQFNRIVGDQIIERSGDGVAVLDFPACDAAVSPLAAFGSRVEVLEPQELRDRLAQIGSQLSGLYGGT